MRSLLILSVLACASLISADSVITLTEANFDDVVDNTEFIVVEFYAPWCGHCKRLEPEYEKAATVLLKDDPPLRLAKVDATENSNLASRFEVRGYPTLKIFRRGEASPYEGPRDADGIVKYVRSQGGPASRVVGTAQQLIKLRNNNAVTVTRYSGASLDLASFHKVAEALRDSAAFAEADDGLAPEGHAGKIILSRRDDSADVVFDGDDLQAFIKANSLAVGGEITNDNRARYAESGLPILTVYFDVDYTEANVKHTNYFKRRVQKVAGEFEGKLVFGFSDSKLLQDRSAYNQPADRDFAVTIDADGLKYGSEHEKFSLDNLRAFANAYLEGQLEAYVKSEDVPESQDGPVTVVVGKTFNDIVMDDSKDVLIEFYAPWCGHCKKLIPAYDELGAAFSDTESVVIAKMDATANDHSGPFEVRGFPTIYFKPAGGKPVAYNGGRSAEDMEKYIRENAKTL